MRRREDRLHDLTIELTLQVHRELQVSGELSGIRKEIDQGEVDALWERMDAEVGRRLADAYEWALQEFRRAIKKGSISERLGPEELLPPNRIYSFEETIDEAELVSCGVP